jgi:hypothetical protein
MGVHIKGLLTAENLQRIWHSNVKLWRYLRHQNQFTATIKALYKPFLLHYPGYQAVQTLQTISLEAVTPAVLSLQFCSIGRHAPWHNILSRNTPRQVTSRDRGLNEGKLVVSFQNLLHFQWIFNFIQFTTIMTSCDGICHLIIFK